MKRLKVNILLFFVLSLSFAQNSQYQPALWNLMDLNGKIELLGTYRNVKQNSIGIDNFIEDTFGSVKLDINSNSYFWHPNFLILDVGGTYFPGAGQNNSILQPDYALETVSKQLYLRTTLFRKKRLNYSTFFNYTDAFTNAENIFESVSKAKEFGGKINYRNKYFPLRINYINFDRKQEQDPLNRIFTNKGSELEINSNSSFSKFDKNTFNFSQRNYNNALLGVYDVKLNTTTFNINNYIYINKNKGSSLNSNLSSLESTGFAPFKSLNLSESMIYTLPSNFKLLGYFNYNNVSQINQNNKNLGHGVTLQHKLYESLGTFFGFESQNRNQNGFKELSTIIKYGFNYSKKIPLKGKFVLDYNYVQNKQDRDSRPVDISFFNEPLVLSDSSINLLQYPDVIKETIVIKDFTGALIYQENVDYIIIDLGEFYEIQRLPGGLIPDNTQVLVDFTTQNIGSFNFSLISKEISAQLFLFKDFINVYYKHLNRDYKDVNVTTDNVLNYINQNVFGMRLQYKGIYLSAERDYYKSNIVPYKLNSYIANITGQFNNKLIYTLNANVNDYDMIAEEGRSQLFVSTSASLAYKFNYKTKLNVTAAYRKQEGEGIDLDLFTSRAELTTTFNKLTIALSADLYRRQYLITENYNFNAINLRITRNF